MHQRQISIIYKRKEQGAQQKRVDYWELYHPEQCSEQVEKLLIWLKVFDQVKRWGTCSVYLDGPLGKQAHFLLIY